MSRTKRIAWAAILIQGYAIYARDSLFRMANDMAQFRMRVYGRHRCVLLCAQMRWERLTPVLNRWIPPPHVLHPYPDARFYATHPS